MLSLMKMMMTSVFRCMASSLTYFYMPHQCCSSFVITCLMRYSHLEWSGYFYFGCCTHCSAVRPLPPFISNLEHTYLALHMLSVVMFALMWDPTPRVAVFNPFICLFGLHVCHSYIHHEDRRCTLGSVCIYSFMGEKI